MLAAPAGSTQSHVAGSTACVLRMLLIPLFRVRTGALFSATNFDVIF
jgi:hypothetical protein